MRVDPLAGPSAHRDVRSRAAGMRFPACPARGSTRVSIPVGTIPNAGSRDASERVPSWFGTTSNSSSHVRRGKNAKFAERALLA